MLKAKEREELPTLERSSLFRQATDLIRHSIVSGVLAPGEIVSVREVATRLGVSPTPIREAMIYLNAVGLVEFYPGRIQIAAPTSSALRDAFELREALEGMAARLAAVRRTDEDMAKIAEYSERSLAAVEKEAWEDFLKYDLYFHRSIGEAARSLQVERYLTNALDLALTLRNLKTAGISIQAKKAYMHRHIVDAIARMDPDEAEKVSRAHVREVHALVITGRGAAEAT